MNKAHLLNEQLALEEALKRGEISIAYYQQQRLRLQQQLEQKHPEK